MDNTGVWSDFDATRHTIKNNTVDRLKQILSGFNEECATHITKTGKKQEVIDRIVSTLDTWRAQNMEDKWTKGKAIITQVRNTGIYTPNRMAAHPVVLPPPNVHGSTMSNIMKNIQYASMPGSSSLARYDPYAPPRKLSVPVASSQKTTGIRFRESPFFRVDQAVSPIVECPESTSATDRRQQTLNFSLTNDHISKLKAPGSNFQLRLFCTSSIFFSGSNSFRTNHIPCPIEFPPTCEVRVNNVQLAANLKGLKKKPGTAPPADIGKYCRISTLQNKVEIVYVNSQQPASPKKYYLVVMLVEATTVEKLVSDLKAYNHRSSQNIRQSIAASFSEDDDIIAGPQKMSLKCPLSFMRVETPCRSSQCVHSQCFDATSWFSVMEQTTTWLCPVCERVLDHKDLIIDGYFDEILRQTPESVDDVVVEADGEWHTADNKYGAASWITSHPALASTSQKASSSQPTPRSPAKSDLGSKTNTKQTVLVLDSDDEDEGQVKRELSPSFASGSSSYDNLSVPRSQTQVDSVIDLTLDSDEERQPSNSQSGKRKAMDSPTSTSPTEQIWKKSRADPVPLRTASYNNTSSHPPALHNSTTIPALHYVSNYQRSPQLPDYPYTSGGSTSTSNSRLSLPSISAILQPGTNGRWS